MYKAFRGDSLDEVVMRILNENGFYLPVIRIFKGKYLIGTETKMISIRGEVAAVRVGGGWERLDLFLARV